MSQHAYKTQPQTTPVWTPSVKAEIPGDTANDNEKRSRILEARRKRRSRLSAR